MVTCYFVMTFYSDFISPRSCLGGSLVRFFVSSIVGTFDLPFLG